MLKKTIIFVLTFMVIYVANFFIPRLMPGDPFSYSGNETSEDVTVAMSEEETERLKAYYGLDKPITTQFMQNVKNNLKGDFGLSIYYKKPVREVIAGRLPWTLYIMFTSLILSLLIGVLLALACMNRKKLDSGIYNFMSVFTEIPPFVVGILFLFLIAANVKAIPLSGNLTAFKRFDNSFEFIYDVFIHSLLPIASMVVITVPRFFFTARSSFLTIKTKKYIMNAKAKGLSHKTIMFKYILLNGIFPIMAAFFLSVGQAIGGALLIENVFAYPGLGRILRESVKFRDYALIQGVFMLSTVIVLVSSFASDLINSVIAKEKADD